MKHSSSKGARGISVALAFFLSLAGLTQAQLPRNPQEPKNLVSNGSFENPPVEAGTSALLASAGAWSATAGSIEIQSRVGTLVAFAGNQHLELDSLAAVHQTCRTRAGATYSLSFAYRPRTEADTAVFEVWFAGALLETVVVPAGSAATWSHKSWLVTGASSGDVVELRSLDPASIGVLIDDVFLMPYATTTDQRVRNGNFEEDPRLDPDTSMDNAVYVGWYCLQNQDLEMRDLGVAANGASGDNVIDLDDARGLGQRVFVVPDKNYQLRFAFSPNPADDRNRSFTVSFGGRVIDTIAVPTAAAIAWTTRTYTVTSESPLTSIEFQDLSGGSNGALIDAVGLTGIVPDPETNGQVANFKLVAAAPTVGLRLSGDVMFARGVTSIGDLDGDGVQDLAAGAVGDDTGALHAGAVWIMFMRFDRTVRSAVKIGEGLGGFVGDLQDEDGFGRALSGIGDLDGDGIPDLCVGANERDTGSDNAGVAYILFMNRNGTVRAQHEISALSSDTLEFRPARFSEFGASIAGMGDIDGDSIPDVVIGARFYSIVQVCFLRRDGSVRASKAISYGRGGFTDRGTSFLDLLGMSVANMGDFDNDGVNDLLVGAYGRSFAGQDFVGGQYLMLLNRDGSVRRWFYYGSENMGPRSQTLGLWYNLGTACCGPGDIDGDGVRDIIVGAQREGTVFGFDRTEGTKRGAAYVLLLESNGAIKTCQRIGDRAGGLDFQIPDGARVGESLAALGDFDGNGVTDVIIGSRFLNFTGAMFLCELKGDRVPIVPLRADFTVTPPSGPAPLTVQFNDLSTGPIAGWSWDFGDGTSSTEQSPSHAYAVGTWTARLTVSAADATTNTKIASITATSGDLPVGVTRLGCGVNPAGSFRLISGVPRIGTSMTFGVDNPLGTQPVGSIPMVLASWTADARRPCGTLVANQGMSAPGTSGERLISTATILTRSGTAWAGPGNPAPVVVPIPRSTSVIGRTLFVQGRMVDNRPGAPIQIGLGDGFALTIQP